MYPSLDFFSGASVKLTGDDRVYATNDAEIEKFLKNNPKSLEYLGSYYLKNTSSIVIVTVALACGVWVCADAISYQVQNDKLGLPMDLKEVSLIALFAGGTVLGSCLQIDGYNDLFKSINEYNISISGTNGAGAVIGKNIKF
jgi:hypothetical protein